MDIDQYIKDNFSTKTMKEIGRELGINKETVRRRAKKLGLSKNIVWNEENIQFLREHWPESPIEFIVERFNLEINRKDLSKLYNATRRFGISRVGRSRYGISDISWMIEDTLEKFYWVGFIFADGCISCDNELSINILDKEHLEKFAKKSNCKIRKGKPSPSFNSYKQPYSLSCGHINVVKHLISQFGFNYNKTYNPPNTSKWDFTDDQLISLFIGFIDGDGHIKEEKGKGSLSIEIENHGSWVYFHNFMSESIGRIISIQLPKARINKKGYSKIFFNQAVVLYLADFIKRNRLTHLERKWEKVFSSSRFKEYK